MVLTVARASNTEMSGSRSPVEDGLRVASPAAEEEGTSSVCAVTFIYRPPSGPRSPPAPPLPPKWGREPGHVCTVLCSGLKVVSSFPVTGLKVVSSFPVTGQLRNGHQLESSVNSSVFFIDLHMWLYWVCPLHRSR
ncbi:uncharacterized protein LOC144805769 [Lissotriton helveticus]